MSTDLDTRLRALAELSVPSHERLGTEELHRRANRRQQRTTALRVIPVAIVVVALLVGAVVVRGQGSTTDVVVGPPDTDDNGSAGLSDADQQVVDLAASTTALAGQMDREMLLSATFAATGGTTGADELVAQRVATDEANATYRDALAQIDTASVAPEVAEAVQQSLNRLDRLPTSRRSVDELQTDPFGALDPYANTTASLVDVTMKLAISSTSIDLMRGLLTTAYAGVTAAHSDKTSALLTISVDVGFYADWPRSVPGPGTPVKGLCGEDADGAKDRCPAFWDALQSMNERDQAEVTFLGFASGQQKQWYRAADAGSDYDQLVASAFEDGTGINDLRGTAPTSKMIDPAIWRQASLDRLDRLAAFQQQLLDSIGEPVPEPTLSNGSATGTAPSTTIPAPAGTDSTIAAPTTTGP